MLKDFSRSTFKELFQKEMHSNTFMYITIFSICFKRYPETLNTRISLVATYGLWLVICAVVFLTGKRNHSKICLFFSIT